MSYRTNSKIAGVAPALALAAGLLLASGGPAGAIRALCSNWSDAPAGTYCSGAEVTTQDDRCTVNGSCSVTFTYGSGGASSVTLTPSLSMTVGAADVDEIVICIAPPTADSEADFSYTATIRTSCNDGEYTAAQAVGGQFND